RDQPPASTGRQHTEHRGDGEQDQDDQAGAAGEVPQQGPVGRSAHPASSASVGQSPMRRTPRSGVTRRAVTRWSSSQAGAASPNTIAAVLAGVAPTAVAPNEEGE